MALHPFSPAGRLAALAAMERDPVDLLIVGGGITGCGLARDAALRGLRTALVEQNDFGSGTSSRSSKLVHGGVRYLAQGDFRLVREAGRERQVLQHIAPHLVHPLTFVLPIYRGGWKYRLGFRVFDWLTDSRHRRLTPAQVLERIPGLRAEDLTGGIEYDEFITDDARLTLANALSAAEHGALVTNHARVVGFLRTPDGRVAGARVQDQLTNQTYEVRAAVTVNATGPWAEATLGLAPDRPPQKHLLLSKGIHLVFKASRLPVPGAVILKASYGREGFAIRRADCVYVGTTDEAHHGPPDAPTADEAAVATLLRLVQDCFPQLGIAHADIVATWAGLRPLVAQPGKSPRDTSRHDEIWQGPAGLITIAGGKLSTYRSMADRVMDRVLSALNRPAAPCRTAEVPLPGADPTPAAPPPDLPPATLARLRWLYGEAGLHELLRLAADDPTWLDPLAPDLPALRAEVKLAVEQEMALTLADFLDRRSALRLFSPHHARTAAEAASHIMAALLNWTEPERLTQLVQSDVI